MPERTKTSKASVQPFADDRDAFLAFIDLERGLSKNTVVAYQRDLAQAEAYFGKHGAANWRVVTPAHAAAWVHSLSSAHYTVASLSRKLTALRMLARFLVRERRRDDDFTSLLSGPKLR